MGSLLDSPLLDLKGSTLSFPRMLWIFPMYPSYPSPHLAYPGTTASPSSVSLARNIPPMRGYI